MKPKLPASQTVLDTAFFHLLKQGGQSGHCSRTVQFVSAKNGVGEVHVRLVELGRT